MPEESEFESSIAKRPNMRREKNSEDEQPDTTVMPENEESGEQRGKWKRQELKILTPNQMLSRLPITSA